MQSKWPGILVVDEITHERNGKILFKKTNIHNMLHVEGEERILKALFTGGNTNNSYIPQFYYIGLDNRQTINETDTYTSISGEPNTSTGYARQAVSSLTGFTVEVVGSTVKAKTALVGFTASTSSFGPIKNLFLTNVSYGVTANAVLYSSVEIGEDITVAVGDTISLKYSMSLKNC